MPAVGLCGLVGDRKAVDGLGGKAERGFGKELRSVGNAGGWEKRLLQACYSRTKSKSGESLTEDRGSGLPSPSLLEPQGPR